MKMYILIKKSIPIGHAINCAAHAGLIAELAWRDEWKYIKWRTESFKKVTCGVTDKQFEKAKELDHEHFVRYQIVTEDGIGEVALVFFPTGDAPQFLKDLKLYE